MKGRIFKSTGSWYEVLAEDHKKYECRVRGKFRLDEIKESNPVAVGDYVIFELENDIGSITEILPRQNHILRQSVKKTGHASVLAANVDQVMLVATFKQPRTSWGFIDRFLVAAESFRIPQVLVFNKKDILTQDQLEELLPMLNRYESFGVSTMIISAGFDDDISNVHNFLEGKTTLVAGHSGVGKSTLLNRLSPIISQATSTISDFSDKGTHTTTFAEMVAGIKQGLLVEQLMGATQGNVLNGDFSGNVLLGYKIENGRLAGRVKNTMVSGNVYQALKQIPALGNDARWVDGFLHTPSICCSNLPVASKGG